MSVSPSSAARGRGHPIRRLLPLINVHGWKFWGGLSIINLGRVFELLVTFQLKDGIDRITRHNYDLAYPALGIIMLMLGRYFGFAIGRRMVREVGVTVTFDMRERLYWHFQLQGPKFFSRFATGDLMARAINDLNLVRMMVGQGSRQVFVLGFSGIISFGAMLYTQPRLTVLLLPVLPFIFAAGLMLSTRLYRQSTRVQEGFSSLSEQVQENLNGIRTIQTHAQEAHEIERFTENSGRYANNYFRLMVLNAALNAWMVALTGIATVIILGYGGTLVLHGQMSAGAFVAFLFFLTNMVAPIQQSGQMVTMYQRGVSGAARLFEIFDCEPEIRDLEEAAPLDKIGGTIAIRHLSFSYPPRRRADGVHDEAAPGTPALRDISFDVAAGEMIAILGRVGSGKSTLLRLIVRLLDPLPGTVYLDGRDVRMLPLKQVRGEVSLVPQDAFLFAARLGHNIAYDNPERGMEEIWQAAEAADLQDTIDRFPDRLETLVGERGVTLSGGQKQRTSLARGLIRGTPVLLLDDCFSSVDTETEEHILAQLKTLRSGRTTMLVSHRVSTARHADRILVLDEGRIAEIGTHSVLMAKNGIYAQFARVQGRREELVEALDAELHGESEAAK